MTQVSPGGWRVLVNLSASFLRVVGLGGGEYQGTSDGQADGYHGGF